MVEGIDPGSIEEKLNQCESALGYRFNDRELLERCLTHSSVSRTRLDSNERLEFLGDAILGMVVCELLYEQYPDFPEGEMTRIKSTLVSRNTCAEITEELGLDQCLFLGKGLLKNRKIPLSVQAAVYESLVAGLYIDGGWKVVREFILNSINSRLTPTVDLTDRRNFKSLLQQISQQKMGETPIYRLLDEKGPDHLKCFKVAATISSTNYTPAWGASKKEAEQRAAQNAVFEIDGKTAPHTSD